MNSFETMSYSWFGFFFFLFGCLCNSSSESTAAVSYAQHCSSVVPEYTATSLANRTSLPGFSTPYFTGSDGLPGTQPDRIYDYSRGDLSFQIQPDNVYETTAAGVYKVEGFLSIRLPGSPQYWHLRSERFIRFATNGFWSEKSRNLCMLGSSSWNGTNRDAVLKLNFEDETQSPTIYTGVASGILESTASANDPTYFDPVLIFNFPEASNYNYSLVEKGMFSDVGEDEPSSSLRLDELEFCRLIRFGLKNLELEYSSEHCRGCSDSESDPVALLPRFLSFTLTDCSSNKTRFVAKFLRNISDHRDDFSLGSTLIGEGLWDDEKKRIIGVACEILNPSQHFGDVVGDCSMRFNMKYSSILTIRNDSRIVGQIWSSSKSNNEKINVKGYDDYNRYLVGALPDLAYEYTELDRATKSCNPKKAPAEEGNVYPDEQSRTMKFDMNLKNGQGRLLARAYARPSQFWTIDDYFQGSDDGRFDNVTMFKGDFAKYYSYLTTTRIRYKIRMRPVVHGRYLNANWLMSPNGEVEITAEGMYDPRNGFLCMAGCRRLVQNSTTFADCEVVVEVELPPLPLNGKKGDTVIKGMIRSTRSRNDTLHFDDLILVDIFDIKKIVETRDNIATRSL